MSSDKSGTGWQDPSTDIENVNAAYRVQYELANHYRVALGEIAGLTFPDDAAVEVYLIASEALRFDPLSRERKT